MINSNIKKPDILPLEYFEKRDFTKPSWKINDYINDKHRYEFKLIPEIINFNNNRYTAPIILRNIGYDTLDISVEIQGDFDLLSPEKLIVDPDNMLTFFVTPLKENNNKDGYLRIAAINSLGNPIVKLNL